MGKTKSVKSAGRFGPRYGSSPRKRLLVIEQKASQKQRCPSCKTVGTVGKSAAGIWTCRACGLKFAGGAYVAQTTLGKTLTPEEFKTEEKGARK